MLILIDDGKSKCRVEIVVEAECRSDDFFCQVFI